MDLYNEITERIITRLESGVIPWRQTWRGGFEGIPKNFISKKPYRGFNILMLLSSGYINPYWITFNQAKSLGGSIKKGEKSTPIIYFDFKEVEGKNDKTGLIEVRKIPFLRYYCGFNLEQTAGIEVIKPPEITFNPIDKADEVINGYSNKPLIKYDTQQAFYNHKEDYVNMPKKETFINETAFYSTLYHELGHSTGHKNRLNRGLEDNAGFNSNSYSKEELIAEFTASYLCGISGIMNNELMDNSTAYIQHWIKRLREDKRLLITASSAGQKAADYILKGRGE